MTLLSKEEEESDEEEQDLVEALHEIVAHTMYLNDDEKNLESELETFSHMNTVHDPLVSASFTDRLQDAAVRHVVCADEPSVLEMFFGDTDEY